MKRLFIITISFITNTLCNINTMHHGIISPSHQSTHSLNAQLWRDPAIKPSPPPPLTGKKMGTIETLGIPPLGYELDGTVKVFHLIAQPVEKTIADEQEPSWHHLVPKEFRVNHLEHKHNIIQKLRCWGYNGSMPGPTIEVFEGDRIRIIVKNELPEPTSVHWHGIELPNFQDGAGGITQRPIMPGETFTYEFTLYQSGTYMYHSGFNLTKQELWGLVGFFIIHPKSYEHKIDKDFAIMLHEWVLKPGNPYPNLVSMDFNWATMNGLSAPKIPYMHVKEGERVRIRLANMSMNSHPIHIHGYVWDEVGTEGGPIPKSAQRKGSTINVPPGSTRDVEFVAWNPGLWSFHCHKMHHVMNGHAEVPLGIMPHGGMFTILYVEPRDPKAPWHHPHERRNEEFQKTESQQKRVHDASIQEGHHASAH